MAIILIVDDEEKICFALSTYLTGRGHRTLVAATAEKAVIRSTPVSAMARYITIKLAT